MPGETGLDLMRSLRQHALERIKSIPVLLLTAMTGPEDRISGLEVGADDYLAKPFEPRELLLRIQSILRRLPKAEIEMPRLKLGRWKYDQQRDELSSDDEIIRLTDMEANLMRVLATEPGVVLGRDILAERTNGAINDRTIDVQITRLRRKIEPDVKNPRYIVTIRGEGYMLMPDR